MSKISKLDDLTQKYVQLCIALGELEYHQAVVLPRRKKELEKQIDQLQKQANKCQPKTDGSSKPSQGSTAVNDTKADTDTSSSSPEA